MSNLAPSSLTLLPFVRQANADFNFFDEEVLPRIAEIAVRRCINGLALYTGYLEPSDLAGLKSEFATNPIAALQTIVERAIFLWQCHRQMEALARGTVGKPLFPALKVSFCSFCPPSRAGKTMVIASEEIKTHPLLDCTLPRCNGIANTVSARGLRETVTQKLPPVDDERLR